MYPHIMLRGTSPKACESLVGIRHRLVAFGGVLAGWKATEVVRGVAGKKLCLFQLYLGVPVDPLRHAFARQTRVPHLSPATFSTVLCRRSEDSEDGKTGGEVSRRARMDCLFWSLLMV